MNEKEFNNLVKDVTEIKQMVKILKEKKEAKKPLYDPMLLMMLQNMTKRNETDPFNTLVKSFELLKNIEPKKEDLPLSEKLKKKKEEENERKQSIELRLTLLFNKQKDLERKIDSLSCRMKKFEDDGDPIISY